MADGVAAFWSYVRDDDDAEDGRILSLTRRVRHEYRLQTSEELSLFVDRDSIEWGEEWSQRIEDAIAVTTFFLPLITPSYFKSQACRRELLKFVREAQRLGLEQLLMPVYWVRVRELEDAPQESSDEAIRLVTRYQRQDLRAVRLEDEGSAPFRKAVADLAEGLAERAAKITATVQDIPERAALGLARSALPDNSQHDHEVDDDELGLLDKMAVGEESLSALTKIIQEISTRIEVVAGLVEAADRAIRAGQERGQSMRTHLVATERLAKQLDAPATDIEELGHRYAAALAELDPAIHAFLDVAENTKGDGERPQFLESMQELEREADAALQELETLVAATREAAKLSRSLRAPLRRMGTGLQGVLDGRAIIEEWGRRAARIGHDNDDGDSP